MILPSVNDRKLLSIAGQVHGSSLNNVRTKSFTAIRVAFAAASL